MKYSLEIRPLATVEIIEAYSWYESQREGLGIEFLDSIEAFNDMLLNNPYIHSYYQEPVRHGTLDRFPYSVVYEIFEDSVIIYSVFMHKRNPIHKYDPAY